MGGHTTDGCGEFMPSLTSSPSYPTSLKCAACGCQRNFHRRDPDESLFPPIQHLIENQPLHRHHPPPPPSQPIVSPGISPSPPPISSSYYPPPPHMPLALTALFSPPPADNHLIPPFPTTPGSGVKP
ncbi:hypothetical protein L1987_30538 [Smallanthus sonchifolius]|uniref:Uncharacterized protein n=1 Tax=Smallanthus sonchifolius TaxID=185202 RepID=A0ACB9I4L1_9ASTR|nr:hypothetical protein L1987_30538 [Smallanthus sonchifolius]